MTTPKEIPGMLRLVELRDDGSVRRRYGVNFRTESDVIDYATDYLGLETPDLDIGARWRVGSRRIVAQVQLCRQTRLTQTDEREGRGYESYGYPSGRPARAKA